MGRCEANIPALKEVNVALGGGGAKGFVHLGVLEELTNRSIRVEAIVGTSIGAIIGSLFAYYSTTLFRDRPQPQQDAANAVSALFLETSFWKYADWSILSILRGGGVFRGSKVRDWLKGQLRDRSLNPIRFSDLEFPLTITATNAHTGECLLLNREREPDMCVFDAVRASMSIQGIFRAVKIEIGGQPTLCWDGGTTGNCRFDLARRLYQGRPTIASSLTYRGEVVSTETGLLSPWMGPWKVLNHTTSILMRAFEEGLKGALPEEVKKNREIIFVEPSLSYGSSLVSTYDFHLNKEKRELLIANGRAAAAKALDAEQ
jgi:predicted acylesterase/phospholipase RssA